MSGKTIKETIQSAVSKKDGHKAGLAVDTLRIKRGFDYAQVFAVFKIVAIELGIDYTLDDHEELMELADEYDSFH